MYILGISEIDNDSGAVLLKDGAVVCAINEERLSRTKRHQGFPYKSVDWILAYAGINLSQIDKIAVAKADPVSQPEVFFRPEVILKSHNYFDLSDPASWYIKLLNFLIYRFRNIPRMMALAKDMSGQIRAWAKTNGVESKLVFLPHHYTHAACAYYASGLPKALVVTLDGQGDGISSAVYLVDEGKFELLHETPLPHSLGFFYASVTKACGFKPNQHEGKITGLAAYAKPHPKLLARIRELAYYKDGSYFTPSLYGSYPVIKLLLKKYGREQMSAAFQQVLEGVTTEYVNFYVKKTGAENLVLAGGVVANVKLNQRLHHISGVKNIFIFPHMADGGLGYGAAQIVFRQLTNNQQPLPIKDVYWGPEFSDAEIEGELKNNHLTYQKPEKMPETLAKLLAEGKVVGHFFGRMEFGPRALGNRSILAAAGDKKINQWLNDRLHRSEFMPFAPVTLTEQAGACFRDLAGSDMATPYMTITLDCTQTMKEQAPAVVHVDGTARPQIINRETNPRYYDILNSYFKLTGIPSLVNTSFNMHEEPIICTPKDAVRSFLQGNLDYLAIGNFLVERVK